MKVIYEQFNGEKRIIGEAMSTYRAKQLALREVSCSDASKIECTIRNTIDGEPTFHCKIPNGIAVNIGDDYFWRDPDRDYNSGFFTADSVVCTADPVSGDIIMMVGGCSMQRHELTRDKPEGLIDVIYSDENGATEYCGKALSQQAALAVCADTYADNPEDYTCSKSEPLYEGGAVNYVCIKQKQVTADLTLKISIRYLLNSTTEEYLRNVLQRAAEHLSDTGMLTGETDAEAVDHRVDIF